MGILRLLIIAGIIFVAIGIIYSIFTNLPHMPGDIFYLRENFTFSIPIITCAMIAGAVTGILWFLKKI